MADILHRTTRQLLRSVNTPDFVPAWRKGEPAPTDGDWIVNPDLSAVADLPAKYWKLSGNAVLAMTQAERDAVDAAEAAAAEQAQRAADKAGAFEGADALGGFEDQRAFGFERVGDGEFIGV